MKKPLILILVIAMLMVPLMACEGQDSSGGSAATVSGGTPDASGGDKVFTIGLAAKSFSDPWTFWLAQIIEDVAKAEYPQFNIQMLDCEFTVDKQLNVVENFITQDVDLIILQPADRTAVGEVVGKAWDAGIPIITNTYLEDDDKSYFVRADPETEGKIEGEYIAEKLPENAKIVIIEGAPGNLAAMGRQEGIMAVLNEKRPDIQILGSKTANWQRAEAMSLMEDWIQAFPEIDAIVSHNDDCLIGAIEAMKAAERLDDDLITIGVDGLSEACYYIKNGEQTASVLNNAPGIAEKMLEIAKTILIDGQMPDQQDYFVEGVLITKDNVDEIIQMHKDYGFWTYD
ncbi:MAG: substrate-binding domain-containing protein [Christensenellales bacterium]|jgi:inositol transport system substrate-binding protein